jgi:quinate dehydrogenase
MEFLGDSYQYGRSPLTPDSLSQPLQICFFGTPISKSLSPVLVPIIFQSVPSQWKFSPVDTALTADFVHRRDQPDFLGSSITMPNKLSYKPLFDALTEEARVIGAVNTTFVRLDRSDGRRRHIGTNTDCVGIRDVLVQKVEGITATAQNRPAIVVGAGGAARSAVYALWRWMNPSEIYIANRLQSEADELISSFRENIPGIKLRYIETIEAAKELPTPYIILGTIPDYPATEQGEIECLKIYNHFLAREEKGVILDMCYIPNVSTKLLVAGRDRGWNVISGMDVVVRVITAQAVLWLEREPPEAGVKKILDIVYEQAPKGN